MSEIITLTETFLVTYSILFGIMLNACIGQNLFPYGQLYKNPKAKYRIIVSFIIVNIIPMIIFAIVIPLLGTVTTRPNFPNIIGIFLISLTVFIWHRLLQAIIVRHSTSLYQKCEIKRVFKNVPLERQTVKGHLWGVVVYSLLAFVGLIFIIFS